MQLLLISDFGSEIADVGAGPPVWIEGSLVVELLLRFRRCEIQSDPRTRIRN